MFQRRYYYEIIININVEFHIKNKCMGCKDLLKKPPSWCGCFHTTGDKISDYEEDIRLNQKYFTHRYNQGMPITAKKNRAAWQGKSHTGFIYIPTSGKLLNMLTSPTFYWLHFEELLLGCNGILFIRHSLNSGDTNENTNVLRLQLHVQSFKASVYSFPLSSRHGHNSIDMNEGIKCPSNVYLYNL